MARRRNTNKVKVMDLAGGFTVSVPADTPVYFIYDASNDPYTSNFRIGESTAGKRVRAHSSGTGVYLRRFEAKETITYLRREEEDERRYREPNRRRNAKPESILSPGEAATHPEVTGFLDAVRNAVKKHFPDGHFHARASSKFGHNGIYIATAVLPKGEQRGGIIQNDPSYNTYWLHDSYTDAGMNDRVKIEMSQGGTLVGPNYTNVQKVGWRNSTAAPASIIKKLDKYYAKLAGMVAARDDLWTVEDREAERQRQRAQWQNPHRRNAGGRVTKKEVRESWYGGYTPRGRYLLEPDGSAMIFYSNGSVGDYGSVTVLRRYFDMEESLRPDFASWHKHTSYPEAYRLTHKKSNPRRNGNMTQEQMNILLKQMGGYGRVRAMTGAYNFSVGKDKDGDPQLGFFFKNRRGPNGVQIALKADDTYTMRFFRRRGYDVHWKDEFTGVYASQLKPLFEQATGLYLSLRNPHGGIMSRRQRRRNNPTGRGWTHSLDHLSRIAGLSTEMVVSKQQGLHNAYAAAERKFKVFAQRALDAGFTEAEITNAIDVGAATVV